MNANVHLVIMAGGVGSRFWPMSTPEMPKQFVDVLGGGKSMLQLTVERFQGVVPDGNVWVVTSARYRDVVRLQLPGVPEDHILLEPCMRNTAPCIAYVSYKIRERYVDANVVFSPSDHVVVDVETFRKKIAEALHFTESGSSVVTLGIRPLRPETGYGYIKSVAGGEDGIRKVAAFKEKPSAEVAEGYVADGNYFWNAGIFVWNVQTVISELRRNVPDVAEVFEGIRECFYTEREQAVIDEHFPMCRNISIDYAVMEKSDNVYVLPSDFGWSDLGTWGSLYELSDKNEEGNVVVGENVRTIECRNCVVHTSSGRRIVLEGLDGYIVAEKDGNLLVCRKEDEQRIRDWV